MADFSQASLSQTSPYRPNSFFACILTASSSPAYSPQALRLHTHRILAASSSPAYSPQFMASVFLLFACILTASSSEVCEKEKFAVSSTAMLQSHQKMSITRPATNPTVSLSNVINLWGYGQLADLQEDLIYDSDGGRWGGCGDSAKIAEDLLNANEPKVVAIKSQCYYHNASYRRFFSVLEQATTSPPPFVLVFGGLDEPLNKTTQERIRKLRGLKACYATNLLDPIDSKVFFPMPLGLGIYKVPLGDLERSLHPVAWEEKTGMLLLPPMTLDVALRKQYMSVLNSSEYDHLVDIVPPEKYLNSSDFLQMMAGYKAVLSPPGRGYDCYRSWESLAVGTVPVVMNDSAFDMRLFNGTGAVLIPAPDELTPDIMRQLLGSLQDPAPFSNVLDLGLWSSQWRSHLQ